jgi:integrase
LAGIEAWTLHDLRRTAASGMAKLGASLVVIEKVLNHVSGSLAGIVGWCRDARAAGGRFVSPGVCPSSRILHARKTPRSRTRSEVTAAQFDVSARTRRGFQAMVERAGKAAGFDMKIHPHMLRHACGFKLANDGVDTRTIQAYLGHKSIQHTVRYTELAPTRFKSLFRD